MLSTSFRSRRSARSTSTDACPCVIPVRSRECSPVSFIGRNPMSIASLIFANEDQVELPIELRQLRYFVRAVELGSIRRAASELGVTVSLLGQDLDRLEAQLSTQLLRRTRSGLIPT